MYMKKMLSQECKNIYVITVMIKWMNYLSMILKNMSNSYVWTAYLNNIILLLYYNILLYLNIKVFTIKFYTYFILHYKFTTNKKKGFNAK